MSLALPPKTCFFPLNKLVYILISPSSPFLSRDRPPLSSGAYEIRFLSNKIYACLCRCHFLRLSIIRVSFRTLAAVENKAEPPPFPCRSGKPDHAHGTQAERQSSASCQIEPPLSPRQLVTLPSPATYTTSDPISTSVCC